MRLEGTGWAWGDMKPHGAVVSQRHGDNLRHGSVPVQPPPAAERGQGAGCHALPCSTVLSLGSHPQPKAVVFLGPKALRGFSMMLMESGASHQELQRDEPRPRCAHPPESMQ